MKAHDDDSDIYDNILKKNRIVQHPLKIDQGGICNSTFVLCDIMENCSTIYNIIFMCIEDNPTKL